MTEPEDRINELLADLQDKLAAAREANMPADVPEGWEHVGWIDDTGRLWGVHLRNGAVVTDRPLYAPPARQRPQP